MRVFFDLMWYFRTKKLRYISGVSVLVLCSILTLIPPRIVGIVIDSIGKHTLTSSKLVHWVLLILGLSILMYGLRYLWRILIFGAAIELCTLLRTKLYQHFTKMSPHFYQTHRTGDLMAHATNDIQAVESTAMDGILMLVDSLASGAVVIVTMATLVSWKLTIVALAPMPIIAWATSYYGKLMHTRFLDAQAAFANINDKVQENMTGVRVIKAFGQEAVETEAFTVLSSDAVHKNLSVAVIDALTNPTITIVVALSYLLTVGVGAYFVVHGSLTIGGLTTFTMYMTQLMWPMLAFGWLMNVTQRGRASHDRIQRLLAMEPEIEDAPDALAVVPSGAVVFDIPTFHFPGTSNASLTDIHFSASRGQTVGLVGKTGSGKSSLLKLMLREYDSTDGDIRIGGNSIYSVQIDKLRSAVAYVPQDHFLFSATIAENIAFAKPGAELSEIQRVAKLAAVHDDIMRFPDGYGTIVGERGVTLSGGQKQRISIARALLLDAEVLILDDSLSAVDARTEVQILDELRNNRKDKTTFIAAHRMSAVEHADLILVLDHGRIIERGTHESLMAHAGWYRDMVERQQLEDLVEHGGVSV